MFDKIKKNIEKGNASNGLIKKFEYLFKYLDPINEHMPLSEAKSTTLYLYFFFLTEIGETIDKYDIALTTKFIYDFKLITIGALIGKATNRFDELMLDYNLIKEFNEIIEKRPIYYELQKIHQNILAARNSNE